VLALANVPEIPPAFTFWALYGDPRREAPEMMHRWCYNRTQMARLMINAGLEGVHPEIPQFHHPIRDMRMVGFKPKQESVIVPA
jgi:hypothetical protein